MRHWLRLGTAAVPVPTNLYAVSDELVGSF